MREATLSETKRGAPSRGRRDTPGVRYQLKEQGTHPALIQFNFRKSVARAYRVVGGGTHPELYTIQFAVPQKCGAAYTERCASPD